MPDTYTHPNGHTVSRDTCGSIRGEHDAGPGFWFLKEGADALRDFFLDELGLWRDEETGALLLTGSWDGRWARVVLPTGDSDDGDTISGAPDQYDTVAARWRATVTPPPREPQPGEVWRIDAGNWGGAQRARPSGERWEHVRLGRTQAIPRSRHPRRPPPLPGRGRRDGGQ